MPPLRRAVLLQTLLLTLSVRPAAAQQTEALWYMVAGERSVQSFLAHADQISVVSPQVFHLDSLGVVSGTLDARVIATAREKKVKLVPLVMNPGFDQVAFHRVLTISDARKVWRVILSRSPATFSSPLICFCSICA